VGAALLVTAACPGGDPPCEVPSVNDAGMRCECRDTYGADGKFHKMPYCDSDIGNPCSIGCYNPREADGGRQYTDAGEPVCFC
jgi:hypothetical protein